MIMFKIFRGNLFLDSICKIHLAFPGGDMSNILIVFIPYTLYIHGMSHVFFRNTSMNQRSSRTPFKQPTIKWSVDINKTYPPKKRSHQTHPNTKFRKNIIIFKNMF